MKPLNNFVNFIVLIRLIIMVLIILPLSPYYYCLNDDKSALLLTNPPPYKPYYRFPDQCPDLKKTEIEITKETLSEEYYKCQSNHIERWRITADHYYTESEQFCCFIWTVLSCEQPLLAVCNRTYSQLNDEETKRLFRKSCDQYTTCDDGNKSGTDWTLILTIGGIVVTGLSLLGTATYAIKRFRSWRKYRNMDKEALDKLKNVNSFLNERIETEYSKLTTEADARESVANLDGSGGGRWQFIKNLDKLGVGKFFRNMKLKKQARTNVYKDLDERPKEFWQSFFDANNINEIPIEDDRKSQLSTGQLSDSGVEAEPGRLSKFFQSFNFWKKTPDLTGLKDVASETGQGLNETLENLAETTADGLKSAADIALPVLTEGTKATAQTTWWMTKFLAKVGFETGKLGLNVTRAVVSPLSEVATDVLSDTVQALDAVAPQIGEAANIAAEGTLEGIKKTTPLVATLAGSAVSGAAKSTWWVARLLGKGSYEAGKSVIYGLSKGVAIGAKSAYQHMTSNGSVNNGGGVNNNVINANNNNNRPNLPSNFNYPSRAPPAPSPQRSNEIRQIVPVPVPGGGSDPNRTLRYLPHGGGGGGIRPSINQQHREIVRILPRPDLPDIDDLFK
ncbi:hypothetical protein HUG17_8369 [Dermatophagoides farinae]|uniref:Uncharacterized protein n=1 Tax=Dermatophagoides farinae TaxID=6954 RepID=A0A9D4SH53_DERFA|nr:hypothetical protein HUG17_8369 [Dermatophagoides farinae]